MKAKRLLAAIAAVALGSLGVKTAYRADSLAQVKDEVEQVSTRAQTASGYSASHSARVNFQKTPEQLELERQEKLESEVSLAYDAFNEAYAKAVQSQFEDSEKRNAMLKDIHDKLHAPLMNLLAFIDKNQLSISDQTMQWLVNWSKNIDAMDIKPGEKPVVKPIQMPDLSQMSNAELSELKSAVSQQTDAIRAALNNEYSLNYDAEVKKIEALETDGIQSIEKFDDLDLPDDKKAELHKLVEQIREQMLVVRNMYAERI